MIREKKARRKNKQRRRAREAMAGLSDENKLAQDLLLQMKDYTPTVRPALLQVLRTPQPRGSTIA